MTSPPDLKDWKFWFAIIGAIITASSMYNQIDKRLTSVEVKMDIVIAKVSLMKKRKNPQPSLQLSGSIGEDEEDEWPDEEFKEAITAEQ